MREGARQVRSANKNRTGGARLARTVAEFAGTADTASLWSRASGIGRDVVPGHRMMRRIGTLLAVLIMVAMFASPQPRAAGLQPDLDVSSPRATYQSFLDELRRISGLYEAYRSDSTHPKLLALGGAINRLGTTVFDLSAVPEATRDKRAGLAVGYLADILIRLPPLPTDPSPGTTAEGSGAPPARWTLPGTAIRLQRATDGPQAGSYVFDARTVARLPEFHAAIIDSPVLVDVGFEHWRQAQDRFVGPLLVGLPLDRLPRFLQQPLGGTPLWKTLAACALALLTLVLVVAWARRVSARATRLSAWRRRLAWLGVPVLLALLAVAVFFLSALEIGLGGIPFDVMAVLSIAALFIAGAWAAWVTCWLIVEAIIASPLIPDGTYDANLLRLLARVTAPLSAGVLLIWGATVIGVPALGLLAGVSVGGIALALAAQSTVENLFGGVSIYADRPFRVGDSIRYGGNAGTVEVIGPRSTRIRAPDGTLTAVPNADLAKMHITNVSARSKSLFQHRITLRQDGTRPAIEALLSDLRQRVAAQPLVEQGPGTPRVMLVGIGPSGTEIEIHAYILTTTLIEFLSVQEALILEIIQAVEESEASFVAAA